MITHNVPAEVFHVLAQGEEDTEGVLRASQRSKRLLLLHELMAKVRARVPRLAAEAATDEAFAVVVDAQRRQPHAVDNVLLQPHVGAWATHCLRSLLTRNETAPADLGYLGAIAAAAAVRAGRGFAVTSRLRGGSVMFPTFGLARLPSGEGWCRIRAPSGDDRVEIGIGETTRAIRLGSAIDAPYWQPLRHLRSTAHGLTIDVDLDDVDPYRGCGHLPVRSRIDALEVEDWREKLDGAWSLLARHHRPRAEAIAAGTRSFVPLRSSEEAPELSATCHPALGAIATTTPPNASALALALVHEFQHTKLSALLDLVPLVRRPYHDSYYSPFRADPRPLPGLLQGAYAYLGLATFAEVHRQSLDTELSGRSALAHFEFALWRNQVGRALSSLRRSTRLTRAGREFVATMRQRLLALYACDVPPEPRWLARVASLDHAVAWQLRNLIPDPTVVDQWTEAWLAGRSAPAGAVGRSTVLDGKEPIASAARLALFRRRLADPARHDIEVRGDGYGDALLMRGDLAGAADAYRRDLIQEPQDTAAWAGLVITKRYLPDRTTALLAAAPERVRAIHQSLRGRTGTAPDPERLAAWMAATQ